MGFSLVAGRVVEWEDGLWRAGCGSRWADSHSLVDCGTLIGLLFMSDGDVRGHGIEERSRGGQWTPSLTN